MADQLPSTLYPLPSEPEEQIEAALCALLATAATVPVEGALTPASKGTAKTLDADTFISVAVDQSSQDLDFRGPCVPLTLSATVRVRFALADDKGGTAFRDECRRVRAALRNLTGDGCSGLSVADAFDCDAFILDSTSTSFEGGDNPLHLKTYSATLKGRNLTTTTEA